MLRKLYLSFFLAGLLVTSPLFAGDKIDLNTATRAELISLKGIGPKTADAIIEYRKRHGGFKVFADIIKVEGIGNKKAEMLAKYVVVLDGDQHDHSH